MKKTLLFILFLFFFCSIASGATYYAGPSGTTSWPNCTSVGSPCSLSTINSNITAGNTVILNPGTYTTQINPLYSGTSGNRIVYQSSASGNVTINMNGNSEAGLQCIRLVAGQNYITVENGGNYNFYLVVTGTSGARYIDANNADNLIIDGVEIDQTPAYTAFYSNNFFDCDDLIIRNSVFNLDEWTYDTNADMVRIQNCKRYTITNNTFGRSPHASLLIGVNTQYGWVTNNTFSNYWRHGLNIEGYSGNEPDYLVLENNRFDQVGKDGVDNPYIADSWRNIGGIETDGDYDIIRFNEFDRPSTGYFMFSALSDLSHVWFYHNTFYNTKDYFPPEYTWMYFSGCIICDDFEGDMLYHRFLNNIYWEGDPLFHDISLSNGGGAVTDLVFSHNIINNSSNTVSIAWLGSTYSSVSAADAGISGFSGNIQVNPGLSDPGNQDFTLTSSSLARDAGQFLATVVSKNGNTVTLGDYEANAFAPLSWGMPGWTGDTIYDDDGDSYVVQTRPTHNQIGLDDATNIQVGDKLTVVNFSGNFPDIGAHEYGGFPVNQLPNVTIDQPSGAQSIAVDGSVTFACTATDSDGTISSYNWDFDGSPGLSDDTNEDPGSKTFTAEGTYNVCVTVTDNDGGQDSDCVLITVGTPPGPTPYYEWELDNDLTDDQGNDNLTDGGTITYSTGESGLPSGIYGTHSADFDGSTDYLSVANADIGTAIGNLTDTDFTACVVMSPDSLDFMFVVSLYDSVAGERKWAIELEDGNVVGLLGNSDGDSYNQINVGPEFVVSDNIGVCFAVDGSANEYGLLVHDMDEGDFYYKDEGDQALVGTYNTSSDDPDLIIGGFAGLTCCFFEGAIYWVHIFDSKLTRAQMEAYLENATLGNITRVYGASGTYTTSETFHIYVDSTAALTVDKTGGTPYIEAETGDSDIQCPLQTANGSGVYQLDFLCTVSANMTSSDLALTANEIQLNSGSITGGSLDCPDSGPGSLQYESNIVIDTTAAGGFTSFEPIDSSGNTLTNVTYLRGDTALFKLCAENEVLFNDGPMGNIRIPITPETGSAMSLKYDPDNQPAGVGLGNSCLAFYDIIADGQVSVDLMSHIGTMDRDFVTGTDTALEDDVGQEISDYSIPASTAVVKVYGEDILYSDPSGSGSATPLPSASGSITY